MAKNRLTRLDLVSLTVALVQFTDNTQQPEKKDDGSNKIKRNK